MTLGGASPTLVSVIVLGACGGSYRQHLSAPAGLTDVETYLCAVAAVNQLGYQVQQGDRQTGLVVARSIQARGRTPAGDRRYDEITVSLSHEPSGDVLHVIASDRGHGESVLKQCRAP